MLKILYSFYTTKHMKMKAQTETQTEKKKKENIHSEWPCHPSSV